ncbi:MAG: hypothetical protein NVSMB22_24500 [Chloroflexota bacterium]
MLCFWLLTCFLHSYDKLTYSVDAFTQQYDSIRVLQGQVPYRDFFNFTGPGIFWLQAAIFRIFGVSASVTQNVFIVVAALTATCLFVISSNLVQRRALQLFPPLFFTAGIVPHAAYPSHHWYAGAGIAAAVVFTIAWLKHRWTFGLVAAGASCGAVATILPSEAFVVCAAIALFLIMKNRAATGPSAALSIGKNLLRFGLGVALVLIPVVVYFAFMGSLSHFVYDTLIWPRAHYAAVKFENDVPFLYHVDDYFFWSILPERRGSVAAILDNPFRFYTNLWTAIWIVAIPLLAAFASLRLIAVRVLGRATQLRRKSSLTRTMNLDSAQDVLLLCSLVTTSLLISLFFGGNRDMTHVMWITVLAYPTFVGHVGMSFGASKNQPVETEAPSLQMWSAIFTSLCVASLLWYFTFTLSARGPNADTAFRSDPLIQYIRSHTRSADRIAVLPIGGKSYMYGRDAAVSFTLLWPGGKYNTPSQIRQAAEEIVRQKPKLVIFGVLPDNRWLDWKDYFGSNAQFMRFAMKTYGAAEPQSSAVVHIPHLGMFGSYRIYTRR